MGPLPMFPLGMVLLPSMALPLHVFEPRYRALVRDCVAADGEFGVVLIERGSEVGGGDVRTMAGTVARIVEAVELPDGRYALGTVGTRRIAVRAWLDDDPYPRAEVDDWPDGAAGPGLVGAIDAVATQLRRVLATYAELGASVSAVLPELSDDPVLATYQLVGLSPLGPADRQDLLGADSPDARLAALAALLADEQEALVQRLALEADLDVGELDPRTDDPPADDPPADDPPADPPTGPGPGGG